MQAKTKMVWLELIGGLFGWAWIIASIGFIYFLLVAIFGSSPWSRVGWALGAGVIAKWLARGFNDHKARVAFTADLMAQGYTAEAAGEEWYARYTGRKQKPIQPASTDRPHAASGPMTNDESVKIISAYGKALMDRKSLYGDISELPYAKERIKEALIHGIKRGDDPKLGEQLKGAYITLSEWQAGFGSRRDAAELTEEDLKDSAKALARIQGSGEDFLKLPEEVAAEAALLMADLKALEIAPAVVSDASVAVAAKQMAAETLAVAFLRDEPTMAPEKAAKLRAKFATDCPEVFLRIQQLSGQQK
jgi:hypothetical protein